MGEHNTTRTTCECERHDTDELAEFLAQGMGTTFPAQLLKVLHELGVLNPRHAADQLSTYLENKLYEIQTGAHVLRKLLEEVRTGEEPSANVPSDVDAPEFMLWATQTVVDALKDPTRISLIDAESALDHFMCWYTVDESSYNDDRVPGDEYNRELCERLKSHLSLEDCKAIAARIRGDDKGGA